MTYYSFAKFGNCLLCGNQFEFDHSKSYPDVLYCENCKQSKLNPELNSKCSNCKRKFKQFRANKKIYDTCQDCRKEKDMKSPRVGKQPKSRTKTTRWRKKRQDTGKKRKPSKRLEL